MHNFLDAVKLMKEIFSPYVSGSGEIKRAGWRNQVLCLHGTSINLVYPGHGVRDWIVTTDDLLADDWEFIPYEKFDGYPPGTKLVINGEPIVGG